MKARRFLNLLALSLVLTGCFGVGPSDSGPATRQVRLAIGYIPNVQFAPIYVALHRGYFAEEGIELAIDYGWETDGVRLVANGELEFVLAGGDQVLLARAQSLPVVTFLSWWQRFPIAVVSLSDTGIRTPADLVGRKVGIPETFGVSYIGWRALASEAGLDETDVDLEVIGYTQVSNLAEGRVDAAVVYANNEPIQLEHQGYDLVQFPVARHASLCSNGFVTSETVLEEDPDLVRAFSRAFLRGLADTLADPDAAFDICGDYVDGIEENETVQRAVLKATLDYWEAEHLGRSDLPSWRNAVEVMRDADLLTNEVDVTQAFTNAYLP